MSAPVDVLAVLDSLIEYHDTTDSLKGRSCIAARAAVAELVEAVKPLVEYAQEAGCDVLQSTPSEFARLRAALARAGGVEPSKPWDRELPRAGDAP